jgi:hypothetical protein
MQTAAARFTQGPSCRFLDSDSLASGLAIGGLLGEWSIVERQQNTRLDDEKIEGSFLTANKLSRYD